MTETNNPSAEPDGEKWDTWYWKQVEQVQQDINSGTDSFDKSMLTLSSGALGVSLAVIKDIVPLGQAAWISLLLISWVAFALCIVTTVVSFLFSITAQKKHRDLLDEIWTKKKPELAKSAPSAWNKAVTVCTRTALTLFLVGLACTVIFVVVNVSRLHAENAAKTSDAATVTDVGNLYMSDTGKMPEKAVTPQHLEKGRQPMKLVPPPKATVPPAPCPTKE
jgi:hypothetical protein